MRKNFLSFVLPVLFVLTVVGVQRMIVPVFGWGGVAQASLTDVGPLEIHGVEMTRRQILEKVSVDPDTLLDVTGRHVMAILSEPELVRHDGFSSVWQYRTDSCILDVYFSGKKDEMNTPVSYYEIRAREKGVEDKKVQNDCIRHIASLNGGGPHMIDVSRLYKGYIN